MQAEGYPHPEQSGGRSAAEVCTSEARKIGEWLAGARGEAPLSSFCLSHPVGRCGEGGPPRRGGWRKTLCGWRQGGDSSLKPQISFLNLCNNQSMTEGQPAIRVKDGDELAVKLLEVGNQLKPLDDENYFFFEVVRELVDASLTNYQELRRGFMESNYPLLAWACRNLLELTIFIKFVLLSGENARRFGDDRLVDGSELVRALRDLELHYDPKASTVALDDVLNQMQTQMNAESVTASKHLEVRKLAEMVGLKEDYASVNRVCSKLVHPTSWSVLAMNKGTNSFPGAGQLLFLYGVGYLAQITIATREHNTKQGMRPN